MSAKTVFLGGGNMAEALLKGMLSAGKLSPESTWVTDIREDRLAELAVALRNVLHSHCECTGRTLAVYQQLPGFPVYEVLLQFGADPNIPDRRGNQAIIIAATSGDPGIIELLIRFGADPFLVEPAQMVTCGGIPLLGRRSQELPGHVEVFSYGVPVLVSQRQEHLCLGRA